MSKNVPHPPSLDKNSDTWLGGRGQRLTRYQKERIREYCLRRDGMKCAICNRIVSDVRELDIDHVDGNRRNHLASNLRLAHHICNARQYHAMLSTPSEKEKGTHPQAYADENEAQEIHLNKVYEPVFRRFCFEKLLEWKKAGSGVLNRRVLRAMASEYVGCSYQVAYAYMQKLFAENGALKEKEDIGTGEKYVDFRDPSDSKLSLTELEVKYPKEGKRFSMEPL